MKKIFFAILFSITVFFSVTPVFALDLGTSMAENARKQAGYAAANETTLSETIGSVIKTALSLVGTIFLALTVYAGFLWMTAQGDESQVEKAQNIIRAAVIGLVIALSAYGITNFVVNKVVEKTTAPSAAGQ